MKNYNHVNGFNTDVDTAAAEDVWSAGGSYPFPSSAAATTIESNDAADASAGTGARTVRVFGLDANLRQIQSDATLNGTNAVTLDKQFYRIRSVELLTVGSGGTNAGKLLVKQSTTVLAEVEIGYNAPRSAIWTVAENEKYARITQFSGSIHTTSATVQVDLMVKPPGGFFKVVDTITLLNAGANFQKLVNIPVEPGTDIKLRATTSANDVKIQGSFDVQHGME